ncbi:manganese peroxidase 3 [Schizopora paradoxa]|uniref:Peroxidase n=1 Tax=Schizopora paradoxa TaxID=27342 RepID=A0A0H2REZ2_9AGAM|nr:manganese peroxidase 3 [Schizopora paradoxa]
MGFKGLLNILAIAGVISAANYKRVACPDGVHTATNDACCVFFSLADELQSSVFKNICFEEAHHALRLSFQDAIGFSLQDGPTSGGGADGSIIIFENTELKDPANSGIDVAINDIAFLLQNFDVTAGDLIQFAAAVGITNCPGYPRLEFFAGRPNGTVAAKSGLIPLPQDDVDEIFVRMQDAGFAPTELASLLAAHSTGHSNTLIDNRIQVPFDTTPFTFDSQFYLEVLLKGNETLPPSSGEAGAQVPNALAAQGEMRLQSDFAVSIHPQTACAWQSFVNNQELMQSEFAAVMAKVAVVGQDKSSMIDCSEAVPMPVPPVNKATSFPAGTGPEILQLVCNSPFPSLTTDPGQPTTIPECPDGDTNVNDCPPMKKRLKRRFN